MWLEIKQDDAAGEKKGWIFLDFLMLLPASNKTHSSQSDTGSDVFGVSSNTL